MKSIGKKLVTVLFFTMLLTNIGINAAYAETTAPDAPKKDSIQFFNVKEILTVPGQSTKHIETSDEAGAISFLLKIIDIAVKIIGSIALILIIIGGLVLITSGGQENQLDKGKNIIKYGIIGMVIALGSFIIITFINNFLSIE